MPLPAEYRPAIVSTVPARVEVDGWSAGATGDAAVVDAQGTEWFLTTFEGWHGAPAPRGSATDRPGEHGTVDAPSWLGPRVLTVEGVAVAADLASALRARDIAASVCGDPSTSDGWVLAVSEPDRPSRQVTVRRSGETKTTPVHGTAFAWSMILVAADPRRYATAESSAQTGLPQPGAGGLVFPLVFPLTFGSGTAGGELTLSNGGTIAVWPAWEMLGPVTGPVVTNLDTGQRLAFDPTLVVPAGQTLLVDAARKTVTLAGASQRHRLHIAEWFRLPSGDTAVRFSAGSSDPAAALTVRWRDGWT